MSTPIQYNMTNDTVTVYIKGEPHSVAKGSPNYDKLRKAVLNEEWDSVPGLLTVEAAVETWAAQATAAAVAVTPPVAQAAPSYLSDGHGNQVDPGSQRGRNMAERDAQASKPVLVKFDAPASVAPLAGAAPVITVREDAVLIDGEKLPEALNQRLLRMVARNEKPTALINFWRRLKRNPNSHSVAQLWGFLAHCGIPIQEDGTFLAYKGVRSDFRDVHSGSFDNSPGKTVRMDRSRISTDPAQACHVGLHVGALDYARSFGVTTLIVRVDPMDVCCVPNDHGYSKMRVCEYAVMGLYGGQMPNTTFQADAPVEVEAPVALEEVVQEVATVEEQAPAKPTTETVPLTGTPWDDFNPMTAEDLAAQSLDDLRKYARYNCLINGASKIPGGKEALVTRILEARDGTVTKEAEPVTAPTVTVSLAPVVVAPVVVAPEPKPVTQPAPESQKGTSIPLTGTEWDRLNGLDSLKLMEESLDSLRKYATYNCLIVGASKMPGGKLALVTRICEVRGDAGK